MAQQGGKNKKIGRHARNASSKNQAARTAKNKDKHIRANPKGHGHVPAKVSKPHVNVLKIPMEDVRRQMQGPFYETSLFGTVLEWSFRFSDALTAYHRAHHEATKIFKMDEFGQKWPVVVHQGAGQQRAA